jgi:hypothetical protein
VVGLVDADRGGAVGDAAECVAGTHARRRPARVIGRPPKVHPDAWMAGLPGRADLPVNAACTDGDCWAAGCCESTARGRFELPRCRTTS